MYPKMSQYLISSIFLLFVINFFIDLPVSVGVDDPKFLGCSQRFLCGDINISYPFWGGNRLKECGHPDFELKCLENGDGVEIEIDSQNYRVLNITDGDHILQLAPAYAWSDECASYSPRQNISINCTLFDCSSGERNACLYMSYGCLLNTRWTQEYGYPCSIRPTTGQSYYWVNSLPSDVSFTRCATTVMVPIAEASAQILRSNGEEAVKDVLKEGFVWRYDGNASYCDGCENSGGQCGYNYTTLVPTCFCYNGEHPQTCRKPGSKLGIKLGIGLGAGVGSLIIAFIAFVFYRRYQRNKSPSSSNLISRSFSRDDSLKPDPENGSIYFKTPIFSYKELDEATNHFDEKKELGDGGFGTVYHGKLRDGRVVAVKRLFENNYKRVEQFMNEIEILSLLRHQNLVSLYGCTSRHSRELLLVYEYVPNGTIADHIHGDRAKENLLTWPIRMSIAIESADALAYLHASEIIHRDVKSNNILLDNNFHVKVADFGLSRLFPTDVTHVSTAPQGTPGYVDPEYYQCYQLNDKSDVYSFGVVLIELISSKPAVDISRHRHEINLANMAINRIQQRALHELVDPNLGYETDYEVRNMMTLVAELAFRCLQQEKDMRPCMAEVLEILRGIASDTKNKIDDMDTSAAARLLKHSQPLSPDAVTDKWPSRTTTPNTSG